MSELRYIVRSVTGYNITANTGQVVREPRPEHVLLRARPRQLLPRGTPRGRVLLAAWQGESAAGPCTQGRRGSARRPAQCRGLASNNGGEGVVVAWAAAVAVVLTSPLHHHRQHGYPAWWSRQAACIRYHESRGHWHIDTGNGYFGAYQFLVGTWRYHVAHPHPLRGWPARADKASPAQQTFIAWRTWIADGRSWREWGTAGLCGG